MIFTREGHDRFTFKKTSRSMSKIAGQGWEGRETCCRGYCLSGQGTKDGALEAAHTGIRKVRVGIDGASCEHSKLEKDKFEMTEGFPIWASAGSKEMRSMKPSEGLSEAGSFQSPLLRLSVRTRWLIPGPMQPDAFPLGICLWMFPLLAQKNISIKSRC